MPLQLHSTPFGAIKPFMTQAQASRANKDVPNVCSALCFVFPYYNNGDSGNISLYARAQDYHIVVRQMLEEKCRELEKAYPQNIFKPYADSAIYPEVYACACAGLGVIGQNNLLLTKEFGSYVFCGIIATDFDFGGNASPNFCIGCGKCKIACPSGALCGGSFDASRCVSAITQQKGELTYAQIEILRGQNKIWGCDECQKCCPYNANILQTDILEFKQNAICNLTEQDLTGLTNKEFIKKYPKNAFTWRGIAPLLRNIRLINQLNQLNQ